MSDLVTCPSCGNQNEAGAVECARCFKSIGQMESEPFELDQRADVEQDTLVYADDLAGILESLSGRVRGANGVLRGIDEARLVRVLERMRSVLGTDQFTLLRRFAEAQLDSMLDERQAGLRAAIIGALRWVEAGGTGESCIEPVKVSVELEPDAPQNLTDLKLIVTRATRRIQRASVSIDCDPEFADVIKVRPPPNPDQSLAVVRSRTFTFPVMLRGTGRALLPVTLHLTCNKGTGGGACSCCYQALIQWRIGADQRKKVVINKVEVMRPDTSIIRVNFDRDAVEDDVDEDDRDTLDGEVPVRGRGKGSSRTRFDLPLYLDVPALEGRIDALYGRVHDCKQGRSRVRASHFLVRSAAGEGEPEDAVRDARRVFFVLLDDDLHVGRSHDNHVVTRPGRLNADESHWEFVGRKHARLQWDADENAVRIRDGYLRTSGEKPAWRKSTNGTGVKRDRIDLPKLLGDAAWLEDWDQVRIPLEEGSVEFPYQLEFRRLCSGYTATGDPQTLGLVLEPAPHVHEALQAAPPYVYAWLPAPAHEALVGSGPGVSVRIPSLDRAHAFRILRDATGYLCVSPCTGVELRLDGTSRQRRYLRSKPLSPHVWYCLGDGDRLTCGGTTLEFHSHPATEAAPVPDLGGCYPSPDGRGPFKPPEDFRDLLLPLMVSAECRSVRRGSDPD